MIKEAIVKIVNKEDLTYQEAYAVMNEIMNGENITVVNKTNGETVKAVCELTDRTKAIIIAGGLLDYTKENS